MTSPTSHSRTWLAGTASAASVLALHPYADGKTVQITLGTNATNNGQVVTSSLNGDLTGDGVIDVQSLSEKVTSSPYPDRLVISFSAGILGSGFYDTSSQIWIANAGGGMAMMNFIPTEQTNFVPVQFTDSRINNGQPTNGLLEIRAENNSVASHTVTFLRLVFDDTSTAEPADAMIGGTKPDWVDPTPAIRAADRAKLLKKIRALKKKLRKAKRMQQRARVKRLNQQLRKLKRQLKRL